MRPQGDLQETLHVGATAVPGVYLLSCAVQGWLFGQANAPMRVGVQKLLLARQKPRMAG